MTQTSAKLHDRNDRLAAMLNSVQEDYLRLYIKFHDLQAELTRYKAAYEAGMKLADTVNQNPYRIEDYAAGVRGDYCISQRIVGAPAFQAFWNPTGWAGSGFVFTNKSLAEAIVKLLEQRQHDADSLRAALKAATEGE